MGAMVSARPGADCVMGPGSQVRLLGSADGKSLALAWEGTSSERPAVALVVLGCPDAR